MTTLIHTDVAGVEHYETESDPRVIAIDAAAGSMINWIDENTGAILGKFIKEGDGLGTDVNQRTGGYMVKDVINAESDALSQEPSTTDTPLQIEFGIDTLGPEPEATLDANGTVTFNEPGLYEVAISTQTGRTSAPGEALLFLYGTVNPTGGTNDADDFPIGREFHSELDNQRSSIPFFVEYPVKVTIPGTQLKYWICRDSSQVNDGGLFQFTPSFTHFGNPLKKSNTAGITVRKLSDLAV